MFRPQGLRYTQSWLDRFQCRLLARFLLYQLAAIFRILRIELCVNVTLMHRWAEWDFARPTCATSRDISTANIRHLLRAWDCTLSAWACWCASIAQCDIAHHAIGNGLNHCPQRRRRHLHPGGGIIARVGFRLEWLRRFSGALKLIDPRALLIDARFQLSQFVFPRHVNLQKPAAWLARFRD